MPVAKFYVTWAVAHGVGENLLIEEIEAESLDAAKNKTREKFASGLIDLTESMAPSLADSLAWTKGLSPTDRVELEGELKGGMLDFARILVPSHQIIQVAVSCRPLKTASTQDS